MAHIRNDRPHAELLARGRPAFELLRALETKPSELAPPEAAALVERFADRFHATPSSGDHLRLPPPPFSNIPGPEIRAAVQRVIDASANAGSAEEQSLRRLLLAYRGAFEHILARSHGDTPHDTSPDTASR